MHETKQWTQRMKTSVWGGWVIAITACLTGAPVTVAQHNASTDPVGKDQVVREVERLNELAYEVRNASVPQSMAYARRALGLARTVGDSAGMALAYVRLGMGHRKSAAMDSAAWFAQRGLGIAQRGHFRKGIMSAALLLADVRKDEGRLADALALERLGLEMSRLEGDKEQEAKFQNAIGMVLLKMGDTHGAMDALFKGLEIRKAAGDTKGILESRLNIANLYFDMDQPDLARSAFMEYLRTARQHSDRALLAKGMMNYAAALSAHGDTQGAIQELDSARILFSEARNDKDLAKALQNLADACRSAGRMADAERYATEAIVAFERSGSLEGMSASLRTLARLRLAKGRFAEAAGLAQRAVEKAREGGLTKPEADSHKLLAQLYDTLGRYDDAISEYRSFIALKDSMINEKSVAALAASEMREKFNAEEKVAEIQELKVQNAQREAARQRSQLQRNAFIALSILLLVLTALLFRNVQHRKKLAAQERALYEQRMSDLMRQQEIRSLDAMMEGQERERKRIAEDLHDRLGSMLSAIKLQFSTLEGRIEQLQSEQQHQYQHVFSLLDDAVGEVRRISHDMIRGSLAQFGLKGALEDLRSAINAPGKLEVELSLFGLEERLEQQVEIGAYRMVQECIGNALKHARATEVVIEVTRSAGMLNIMVEDNGVGFDPALVTEGMGMGNIRRRAAELKGVVRVDTHPGRGTSVNIDIPLA